MAGLSLVKTQYEKQMPESEVFKREIDFRVRFASIISAEPYCHKVYFHEGNHDEKFSIHNARGYVDLYVQTNPEWPYHKKFPVIGVETKLATKMGWLIDAIDQVGKYDNDLKNATYKIDGRVVPPPEIFLVVTPDSWYYGHIYCWPMPEAQGDREKLLFSWRTLTFIYERLLMKHGASVLRQKYFYTNKHGKQGAVTRYELFV